MVRSEAINIARMEVIGNFKVTEVWGFEDAFAESEAQIRLTDGKNDPPVPPAEEDVEGLDVIYVAMGWDSTSGDGDFRVTVRIEDGFPQVVDFEAGDLHDRPV